MPPEISDRSVPAEHDAPRTARMFLDAIIERLRGLERSAAILLIVAAVNDLQFLWWRRRNTGRSYAEFYVWQISGKLDRGVAHKTLGQRVFQSSDGQSIGDSHDAASFSLSGQSAFRRIADAAGLASDDVVVDFGCGSLRVGQHFISSIESGNYWGLDITDRFFKDGVAMIGNDTVSRQRPNLRVLGNSALVEARAARPSLVVSVAVLKHIPRSEWAVYFDQLMSLIHENTRLVITFEASNSPSRILGKSWSCRVKDVMHEIEIRQPRAQFKITRYGRAAAEPDEGKCARVQLLASWDADRQSRQESSRRKAVLAAE